jgi:hypothetical protein
MLFARVKGDVGSSLRSLIYKDVERTIVMDGTLYRFVGSNAENGILLKAPPRLDFPAPFAFAPNAETISFGRAEGLGDGPDELRVEFFAVPVTS